jgi:hypothetical protein
MSRTWKEQKTSNDKRAVVKTGIKNEKNYMQEIS